MIHLVTGGSGSGKSEYAENWLTGRNKKDGTYIYIATMQPYTEEKKKNDMGNYCKYHCRSIADNIKYVYTR